MIFTNYEIALGCIRYDGPLTFERNAANWGPTEQICSLIHALLPFLTLHSIVLISHGRAAADASPLLNSIPRGLRATVNRPSLSLRATPSNTTVSAPSQLQASGVSLSSKSFSLLYGYSKSFHTPWSQRKSLIY